MIKFVTIDAVRERQDEMLENVSKIKEVVYNPDEGLYARIRAPESWKDTSTKVMWTMFTAVVGLVSALVLKESHRGTVRVKIGYTIEKEDIPPLLNQMSCQSLTRAEGLCKVYEKLLSSKDYGVSSLDDIKN